MRRNKLHHSLALCLSLSLSGLTACDLELPTPEEQEEGTTLKDKVVESLTGAQEGSGSVELRMVDANELSARALPLLDTSELQAEITVKAIAVRRCLDDAQEPAAPDETESTPNDEGEAPVAPDETEPTTNDEADSDPESTPEPEVTEASGILARRGDKAPKKDRREDKGGQDLPEADEEQNDLPKDAPELPEGPPELDKDLSDIEREILKAQASTQADETGDTVASDEELAEEGDRPGACERVEWIVLKQDALKIDLMNLGNMDAGGLLAKGELPVGTYRGIRLMISDAVVRLGDKEASLKIPSGKASGLKIRAGFEVQADGQVEIDLGFDLSNSLRKHPKHGWMLRPVLRARKRQ